MSDLIFAASRAGRYAKSQWPTETATEQTVCDDLPPILLRQTLPRLPEVSELQVVRHYTKLSQKNFSIDTHFYPLGSCTMKYNPKFTESLARLSGFTDLHPLLAQLSGGEKWTQGALQILYELEQWMCEMTGFEHFTMQ